MHVRTSLLVLTASALSLPLSAQAPPQAQSSARALAFGIDDTTCVSRTMVCFLASELAQGADLNGDGDMTDTVPHVHDLRSGQSFSLGHAVHPQWMPAASDRFAVFAVSEQLDGGQDRNGDGDAVDTVAFLFDRADGLLRSLDVAMSGLQTPAVTDRAIAFTASEAGQGATDLDGDGVVRPFCTYVLDPVTRVGRGVAPFPQGSGQNLEPVFAISGTRVSWNSGAQSQIWSYDLATDVAAYTGLRSTHQLETRGGLVAFWATESLNAQDLNGDGDAVDAVLAVIRSSGGVPVILPLGGGGGSEYVLDEHLVLGSRYEMAYATDWNGDGDTTDYILFLYDERTGVLTNTGRVGSGGLADVRDPIVAYGVREDAQAGDLNGDGDLTDFVLEVRDISTGSVVNVGRALSTNSTNSIQVSRRQVGFLVSESGQGQTDLDGNGVLGGSVPHVFDARHPATPPVNLGLATGPGQEITFVFDQGRAAFLAQEFATDLNGDGDTIDNVLVVRGSTPGSSFNTIAAADRYEPPFTFSPVRGGHGVVTVRALESQSGAGSLNGDADIQDEVLIVLRLNP